MAEETTETTAETTEETTAETTAETKTETKAETKAEETTETKVDWRDPLEGDLRTYADRFPSPSDAVKAAYDGRQKLSTALVQPGDDTSDEDRNAYYTKLGRPEAAEGYDLAAPENLPDHMKPDEGRMKAFGEAMFGVNAPAGSVKAAMDWYYKDMAEQADAAETALNDYNEKGDGQLKTKWGSDFDQNVEFGKRAWKTLPEGVRGRLEAMAFDGDPELKEFMSTLGRNMGEDGMMDSGMATDQRETLEEKLTALEGSANRWDPKVGEQIDQIRKQLWPGNFGRQTA